MFYNFCNVSIDLRRALRLVSRSVPRGIISIQQMICWSLVALTKQPTWHQWRCIYGADRDVVWHFVCSYFSPEECLFISHRDAPDDPTRLAYVIWHHWCQFFCILVHWCGDVKVTACDKEGLFETECTSEMLINTQSTNSLLFSYNCHFV